MTNLPKYAGVILINGVKYFFKHLAGEFSMPGASYSFILYDILSGDGMQFAQYQLDFLKAFIVEAEVQVEQYRFHELKNRGNIIAVKPGEKVPDVPIEYAGEPEEEFVVANLKKDLDRADALQKIEDAKKFDVHIHSKNIEASKPKKYTMEFMDPDPQINEFMAAIMHEIAPIVRLLGIKHRAYGGHGIRVFGEYGVVTRLGDKIFRNKTMLENAMHVDKGIQDESRTDTWKDTIGYSIIGTMINLGKWEKFSSILTTKAA